jgi:uncharacterized membrane protein
VTPPPTEGRREAQRLEAFSDGVMAVVITIMVLNLNVPSDTTWRALGNELPSLLVYVLSFTLIGTYWNNHHHLLRATEHIGGAVMWRGPPEWDQEYGTTSPAVRDPTASSASRDP